MIENGVDLEKFAGAASTAPQKTLVTIGRFSANKQIPRVLDVLECLIDADPNWSLDIVGSPSDLTIEDLNSEIQERGLGNAVRVHVGLSDEQVREVVSKCSLFVSASEYEGFGIAMIEALSAGLLPIVHPNDAFRGLAGQHDSVCLTDFSRPKEAASAIDHSFERLLQAPEMRAAAMASAQRHGWSSTLESYNDMYRCALGR
ncbi:glycosyltransferase family 4 protein [Roseibium sp.]|uniref:glycosyltransferase family 4 protein n=1 Tax=Roseibium sp. TaxID=1936156 RepID=UPI003A972C4D